MSPISIHTLLIDNAGKHHGILRFLFSGTHVTEPYTQHELLTSSRRMYMSMYLPLNSKIGVSADEVVTRY